MRYYRVPLDEQEPWYDFRVTLSGVRYIFELAFNNRMRRWILSIMDAAQNPILMGIPLLSGRDLTAQYPTLRLPPGSLAVYDTSGKALQAELASFLLDHVLVYADPT